VTDRLPDRFGEADLRVEVLDTLDSAEVNRVALLVERATETDGVRPLSEHVSLHLRYGGGADGPPAGPRRPCAPGSARW